MGMVLYCCNVNFGGGIMNDFKICFFSMLKYFLICVLAFCLTIGGLYFFFGSLLFFIIFFASLIPNFALSLLVSIPLWIVFVAFIAAMINIFSDLIAKFARKINDWIKT